MKLETFFEKFDQFADAPDAVAKMREVVLDLAIQGRLYATTNSDDWEAMRLGEIVAEGLSSVNPAEAPNQLFELWSVPSYASGQPEILTGGEIGSTKRELPDRSILLGKINPHLNRVWKVARRTKHILIASPEWITITPDKFWDPDYLARLLTSPSFNRDLCSTAQGMGSLTRASTKKVAELEIRRPPLAEQKRIVAKVDELMALCDRLEAQQQERETRHAALARASLARFTGAPTPANLNLLFHSSFSIQPSDLRKSILTLAVQGKLVPQDPNDEPADVLLGKVRNARRQLAERGDVKTKVNLPTVEEADEPYSIPETWRWVPLNELTELVYGKLLPTTELLPEGFQVFGANGIIGRYSRYLYEDEMLLISCRGAYSGTPNISPPKCYVTNNSIVCEFFHSAACDIRFFHAVISISPREKMVTGSAQPQVTVANAIKLPVPLPPLAEQRRIVAKVEQLMALVDALETQLAASRATAARLLDALVAELTGTTAKTSVSSASGTGRRGRPRKSP